MSPSRVAPLRGLLSTVGVIIAIAGLALVAACSPERPKVTPPDVVIECVNIDRAFTVWASRLMPLWMPTDVRTMTQATMTAHLEEIRTLLDAVEGYTDNESLHLVIAVTRFEADLSLANAERQFYQQTTIGTAEKTYASYESVHASYQHLRDTTCRGVKYESPPVMTPSKQARA